MPDCLPSARLNELTLKQNIPVSVTIELTRRCPLSCLHCYLPETRGRARPPRELSTGKWEGILSQLAGAGGLYLVFTGGEPLLRPDLPRLCRRAKELKFDVRVFSSGFGMTPALAGEFRDAGVSSFELSFYGGPASHDRVTGRRGSYSETLSAARLLKKAGVPVKMKVPLLAGGGAPVRMEALARREGFGISFDPVIAPANDGDRSALKYRLSGRALAGAVGRIPPGSGSGPSPAVGASAAAELICGAGRNVCAVDPAGNLYPCLQLPVKLGNLTRKSFSSLWKGGGWLEKWRGLTMADMKGCLSCPDRDYCSLCPGISLLEEGDMLAPNGPACEMAAIMRKKAGVSGVNSGGS